MARSVAQARPAGPLPTTATRLPVGAGFFASPLSSTSPRARAQAGPLAAVAFHNLMESPPPGPLPPDLEALLGRYREHYESYQPADARYLSLHRGHLMFLRPEEEPLVGAELIRNLTFTGTEEELRARLGELEDAGYRQWVIQLVPGHEQAIEDWARLLLSR